MERVLSGSDSRDGGGLVSRVRYLGGDRCTSVLDPHDEELGGRVAESLVLSGGND